MFFFFKQKTAYEMRISDWSSDVCSSDLTFFGLIGFLLLTIAAISWGSAAIAGAEESGKLELNLAHGVSRTQYALESALAVLVKIGRASCRGRVCQYV